MKFVIAGSRTITDMEILLRALEESGWKGGIREVVCGMAKGADLLGARWAMENGVPVAKFPAQWNRGKPVHIFQPDLSPRPRQGRSDGSRPSF